MLFLHLFLTILYKNILMVLSNFVLEEINMGLFRPKKDFRLYIYMKNKLKYYLSKILTISRGSNNS